MRQELTALKRYVEGHLKFSNNVKARSKAQDMMVHISKIEDYYELTQDFVKSYEAKHEALDIIQERTIALASQELLPEKFKSHTQWMRTMDAFFKPRTKQE